MPRIDPDPRPLWESIPERALTAYPRLLHRNLDTWIEDEDRAILAAERTRPPALDVDAIAERFRPHLGPDIGDMERELVAGLALSLWGAEHVEAAREQRRAKDAGTPFSGLKAALGFALFAHVPGLGTGAVNLRIAEDKARPNPARVGYDYMPAKQTSNGASRAKGLGVIELNEDVWAAIKASGVSATDRWLVMLVTFGGNEEVVTKGGEREVVRVKWTKEQGGGVGWREKMKRSEAAELLRLTAKATLESVRLALAAFPLPTGTEEARLLALRSSLLDDVEASDEQVSKRITRARKALETAMLERRLIPVPPAPRPSPARPAVAPMRPSFAGDLL